jgi:O-antigen biosynthesis protein
VNALERARQTRRLLRSEGVEGVSARLRERAATRIAPPARPPVPQEHLRRAAEVAAAGWALPGPLPVPPGGRLKLAWVCPPPGRTSGGHTTMFRIISALERRGHECVLYIDDLHGWALERHRANVRAWWPWVQADVRAAADGIEDAHAIFATAWPTAYAVLASPARGRRMYLVQDVEPWFHPAGSDYLLAEATYRFGFRGLTAGRWLPGLLEREYGMRAGHFDFGCDLERYRLEPGTDRSGVCCFSRPSTPRRAHELAMMTMRLFAERHPEVDIHLFGEPAGRLPFAHVHHGQLTPDELSGLYNRCAAGLVLSATNVSLVPHEMLAAGCIPVVNDAEHNRVVLDNPEVGYAPATPFELAQALAEVVTDADPSRPARAAASVQGTSWERAGDQAELVIAEAVAG